MFLFGTNPILFRIKYINGDQFNTASSSAMILGSAVHKALEVYQGGCDEYVVTNESEGMRFGLEAGLKYIDSYNEAFIDFSKTIPTKQKMQEKMAFCFNAYVQENPWGSDGELIATEEKFTETVDVDWNGKQVSLPVPLKGYIDKITRKKDGLLRIHDYKIVYAYSDPTKIDAQKIVQAILYYFGTYAKYGEAPYSMIYEEVKHSANRDGSNQVREWEFVYEENIGMFDLFFRLYQDMTDAIMGKMVWVPSLSKMAFDSDVAIIAYIHRLDQPEEVAKGMRDLQVNNISELLHKKLVSKQNENKFLDTVQKSIAKTYYKTINYEDMDMHDRIKTKFMEFGIVIDFVDKIQGHNVTMYRFSPSIGVKMSTLEKYDADLSQVAGVSGVRVLAPIPNTTYIGIEIPNEVRTFPESIPSSKGYDLSIGEDVYGKAITFDITDAPHMLVAGSTGSGKSVFMDTLIEQLKSCTYTDIHLIDPKMVEFAHHIGEKNVKNHMTEPESIDRHLSQLVVEMNKRYKTLLNAGVKSIKDHNGSMRHKFIFIDEYGDLIVSKHEKVEVVETGMYEKGPKAGTAKTKTVVTNISKQIEKNILVLSQKGRACGIHLIIATQRPSTDIVSGSIKNNFPTKALFRVSKAIDSQVVIDQTGGEKLQGKGDMLFVTHKGVERLQAYKL